MPDTLTRTHTGTLDELLDTYRDAVASRAYWEEHGTHDAIPLRSALRAEEIARTALIEALSGNSQITTK